MTITNDGILRGPSNASYYAFDGTRRIEYRTDEMGLRVDPASSSRTDARFKVLALGDSWIWGTNLNASETIPTQTETRLSQRMNQSVVVLNGGMQGAAAIDIYAAFLRYVTTVAPDAVLVGMPHNSDREDRQATLRQAYLKMVHPPPQYKFRLYLLSRLLVYYFKSDPVASGVSTEVTSMDSETSIADIVRLCKEAASMGLPVYFVGLPAMWRVQATQGAVVELPSQWKSALDGVGAKYTGHAMMQRECWGASDTAHPSPAGARAIASLVTDLIVDGHSTASWDTGVCQ